MKILWSFTGFILFLGLTYSYVSKNLYKSEATPQVAGATIEKASNFLDVINSYRAENKLPILTTDDDLSKIAELRSNDMVVRQYYSHTNPDGITYNAYFQGYKGYSCENLNLLDNDNPKEIVDSWLSSESHRQCLLDIRLTLAGYSIKEIASSSYLTTLILSEQ